MEEAWIPALWEGAYAPLTHPEDVRLIWGALVRWLAVHPGGDDEDRPLVRARISVDAPARDRVWFSSPSSLRPWIADLRAQGWDLERDGLSPWCAGLDHDFTASFEVDPVEVYQRCLPHYHGFLHAWTDEHAARAHFKDWPLRRQASFLHEYLLYAENDRRFALEHQTEADPELAGAAAWLLSKRRYVFRWILRPAEAPTPRPEAVRRTEANLLQHLRALGEAAEPSSWVRSRSAQILEEIFDPNHRGSPLLEALAALGTDEAGLRAARVLSGARELVQATYPQPGEALFEPWNEARGRVERAYRWGW